MQGNDSQAAAFLSSTCRPAHAFLATTSEGLGFSRAPFRSYRNFVILSCATEAGRRSAAKDLLFSRGDLKQVLRSCSPRKRGSRFLRMTMTWVWRTAQLKVVLQKAVVELAKEGTMLGKKRKSQH